MTRSSREGPEGCVVLLLGELTFDIQRRVQQSLTVRIRDCLSLLCLCTVLLLAAQPVIFPPALFRRLETAMGVGGQMRLRWTVWPVGPVAPNTTTAHSTTSDRPALTPTATVSTRSQQRRGNRGARLASLSPFGC